MGRPEIVVRDRSGAFLSAGSSLALPALRVSAAAFIPSIIGRPDDTVAPARHQH